MDAMNEYSDELLVELLLQGSVGAFEQLYERHWHGLYQSACYLLHDSDAGRDVVQEVFVWLWEQRQRLDIKNVKAYLKAAVRFKAANHMRSMGIREGVLERLARMPQHNSLAGSQELLELKELQRVVEEAIGRLPVKCREVYRLSKQEYLSNREIAERLGISIKTVENQMTIALKRLRTRVSGHLASL